MRFEARDGAVIHVDELGAVDGPPLVVVPGGPGRHPAYLGSFDPVAATRRILVLHPRGVGGSTAAPVRSFTGLADDLEDLRLHLGVDALDLLAHATGCRPVLVYAARAPERLAHLLLVAPATAWLGIGGDDRASIARRRQHEPWFTSAIEAARALSEEQDPQRRLALYPRAAPLGWSTWDERALAHERAALWYPDAFTAFFTEVDADELRAALSRVACPVVVVGGEDDALVGLAPLGALAALFPRGSLAVIEGCGHYPWVEAPAEFAIALRAFLTTPSPVPPIGRRRRADPG
ncbi:Pimeloyl-ACP methyl ester carboxylesterase [Rathayibacter oskolensis]|uniref:Pimeloyl-ACP methyl ester carboxylesterase n=1 Tax=Rathayibacter oskolensis TaxID=1891671 RepID=A0A1X7PFG7_9MICO|nr:alpha/beta hydrolase [Rathayibacter oskolensis]SMH49455.1 Pimeloyl-ACP methyl ester carboxylesterase [Rathayibacter oskolensis]